MNVTKYDEMARGVHAPMYDYYAEQIKEKTGITKGVCMDAGCGGGYLGLALARITDLKFIFLDISSEMLDKATRHIIEDGLEYRAKTLHADVHGIPLENGSIDLVISRGSIPFWKFPGKALKEIYRVLAPEGKAYVGGGRGTPEMLERMEAEIKKMGKTIPNEWKTRGPHHPGSRQRMRPRNYNAILKRTGIKNYLATIGEDGRWIQMWK